MTLSEFALRDGSTKLKKAAPTKDVSELKFAPSNVVY